MTYEESVEQLESLIEAWELDEAELNQTDINAMQVLLKENQELKKQLDKASLTIQEMTERDIYCPNSCDKLEELLKENQELKKQFEEYQLQNINLRADIMIQKMAFPNKLIKDKTFYNLYDMPTYEDLLHQQKEFIEYINEKIDICDGFIDTIRSDLEEISYGRRSCGKQYIANEIMKNEIMKNEVAKKILEEILSKYKEIIGDDK